MNFGAVVRVVALQLVMIVIERDGSACWCMWYLLMMGLGLVMDLCLSADWRVYIYLWDFVCMCIVCVRDCAGTDWKTSLRDSVCMGVCRR